MSNMHKIPRHSLVCKEVVIQLSQKKVANDLYGWEIIKHLMCQKFSLLIFFDKLAIPLPYWRIIRIRPCYLFVYILLLLLSQQLM